MEAKHADPFAGEFQVLVLKKRLHECFQQDSGHVVLDAYIEVFKQLYRFFCMLGTVFGFVGSDVKAKVEILEGYRREKSAKEYETLESMLDFEISTDVIHSNKETSGSRTFLRLHRSLIFVSQFLKESQKIEDAENTSHVCKTAYDNTLAKYHPWLIRKGAHLAMYTLPNKRDLFAKVCASDTGTCNVNELVTEVIELTRKIFDHCEEVYKSKDLLSLP